MFSLDSIAVPENGVIVDLGCFEGEFARAAVRKYNPKRLLCVEMLPNRAQALQQDPELHNPPARQIAQCAVGNVDALVAFYRVPKWEASSSLLRINPEASNWYGRELKQNFYPETVVMYTLDYLCYRHDIDHIDLLKIDVQGSEGRVLNGAKSILRRTRTVIIEILFCQHYFGQSSQEEIEALLVDAGFNGPQWLWSCDQEGDAIFRKDL